MKQIFKNLEEWVISKKLNSENDTLKSCYFKILGQTALFEAKCELTLVETADFDAYTNASYPIIQKLNELLLEEGKHYDMLSKEIWMPEETTYTNVYKGTYIKAEIAKEEYVLISKAKKAPEKNYTLIIEYLSKEPSNLFLKLAKKYNINLEKIVNEYQ